MRVVFGIGNPGIRYEFTRHNAGFLLLDYLAKKLSVNFKASTGEYSEAIGKFRDQEFSLVKPVTFVNNSGLAAKQVFEKRRISKMQQDVIKILLRLENMLNPS